MRLLCLLLLLSSGTASTALGTSALLSRRSLVQHQHGRKQPWQPPPQIPEDGLKDVPTVDARDLSPEDFIKKYVQANVPVRIRNAISFVLKDPESMQPERLLEGPWASWVARSISGDRPVGDELTLSDVLKSNSTESLGISIAHSNVHAAQDGISAAFGQGNPRVAAEAKEAASKVSLHGPFAGLAHKPLLHYVFYAQAWGGLAPHVHEAVLTLQVAGRKRWAMWGGSDTDFDSGRNFATFFRKDLPALKSQRPVYDFIMEPGDVLHIPEQIPHATVALDHINVGSIYFFDSQKHFESPPPTRCLPIDQPAS